MNTVNASTNFTGFQLHLGRSPRVIPPIIPSNLSIELADVGQLAANVLNNLEHDVAQARDNLLHVKIQQAHHMSASRSHDPTYAIGDYVMLSTFNRRHEYKKAGEWHMGKFSPRWDSPYRITNSHPEASTYTLDICSNAFPVYHTSKLKPHRANNSVLFPSHALTHPDPIVNKDGLEEFTVEQILDSC
jgi:hypothetical protein